MRGDVTEISLTVSIGLADIDAKYNIEQLLKHADDALYCAKQGGRNRVETVPSDAPLAVT